MPIVKDVLDQFVMRYRRALLTKAGVLAVLSLGIAVVLSWKLHALRRAPWSSLGVPAVIALLALMGLLWWLRRRWMGRQRTAIQLDRAMKLQERLVTAEEFSGAAEPPTLYPVLVHETQQLLTAGKLPGLPRAFDRTAGALAVVLLLLLLWPVPGQPGMRLARAPLGQAPPPPPPQPTPSGATSEDRQPGGSSPAASSSPQSAQSPSSRQGQGTQQEQRDGTGESGRQSAEQQPSSAGATGQPSQASEGQSDQADQRTEADEQSGRQGDPSSSSSGDEGKPQDDGQRQQMASARRDSSKSNGSAEGAGATGHVTQAPQESSARWESRGGGGGTGNQEALKAEIQQLLKELSGELHELQAQLAAADSQAPQAGTQTDPELYGMPSIPEGQRGASIPIQLGTDAQAVNGKRQGGGVGKASGEASSAAPQAAEDVAQLSEQSLELAPVSRQPVPPEYRSVFERLYERHTTTNEP